jgi:hypothetical protein
MGTKKMGLSLASEEMFLRIGGEGRHMISLNTGWEAALM